MQPVTTYFASQMEKKRYLKQPGKKWETNIRQQCIKNKCLADYIYYTASFNAKFVCL